MMSTRSTISTMINGKCVGVYAHWDGYPSHRIPLLLNHYNSQEGAESIVALGSISSLRERIAPNEDENHSFDSPVGDVTIAYHRDRGEDFEQIKGKNKNAYTQMEEFAYHFESGEWWYNDNHYTTIEWKKCSEYIQSEHDEY